MKINKNIRASRRKSRVRSKIRGTKTRPRLSIFRSHKHISAQIIDDERGITLVGVTDSRLKTKKGWTKTQVAVELGRLVAEEAKAKKIKKVIFDRGSYKFHGRVQALAQGAKEGGLEF